MASRKHYQECAQCGEIYHVGDRVALRRGKCVNCSQASLAELIGRMNGIEMPDNVRRNADHLDHWAAELEPRREFGIRIVDEELERQLASKEAELAQLLKERQEEEQHRGRRAKRVDPFDYEVLRTQWAQFWADFKRINPDGYKRVMEEAAK